jgi:hypothetical protein
MGWGAGVDASPYSDGLVAPVKAFNTVNVRTERRYIHCFIINKE